MIHIAIVEDEPEVQNQLQAYIQTYSEQTGEQFQVSVFSDGDEITHDYQATFDIIFLDIQMKRLDGMTTAETIRTLDEEVILIFITNMAHFAIRGYAVDALDFVLKPVPYFAFSQQLQKAIGRLERRVNRYLVLPVENGFIRLSSKKVYFVETAGHRLRVHTTQGEYYLSDTMRNLEEELAEDHFYRSNNSYLVNLAFVEGVEDNTSIVAGQALQISRPRRKGFMEALANYIGGIR